MKQITQARLLSFIGAHEASVMIIRREVELTIRALVRSTDRKSKPTSFRKMYNGAGILIKRGIIKRKTARIIERIYEKASKVSHGNPAGRKLSRSLLVEWQAVRLPTTRNQ